MTRAYSEWYLNDAQRSLGEAYEYASVQCKIPMDMFKERFLATPLAEAFGEGSPKYVCGMSGTELAMEVLSRTGYGKNFPNPIRSVQLKEEYWCGWILAYYQWHTAKTFHEIHSVLSMEDIMHMYPALHQASEEKFVDIVNRQFEEIEIDVDNRLQQQRRLMEYSQRVLAERAGVNLRTLQQYETGAKSLRRASYETVQSLARVLCCAPEDLISPVRVPRSP